MKHIKLLALLMLGMMGQPADAARHKSSGWFRKTIKVSWHAVQVATGLVFLNRWHIDTGGSCAPSSKYNGFDRRHGPDFVVGATMLLIGLEGLDNELDLSEQFKK